MLFTVASSPSPRALLLALTCLPLAGLAACAQEENDCQDAGATSSETFEWSCVTSWPPKFPGLGMAPENLATRIEAASGGRLKIRVYGGGELVPALEVFDAVSRGTVEMGHGASYYHKGKVDAAQFFTAIPFGMTNMELNGWLYYGGGLELYRELYEPFNLVPLPTGNKLGLKEIKEEKEDPVDNKIAERNQGKLI